jgi:hypothetical protein
MRLVRTVPKAGPWPELRTFQCADCEDVVTVEITSNGDA